MLKPLLLPKYLMLLEGANDDPKPDGGAAAESDKGDKTEVLSADQMIDEIAKDLDMTREEVLKLKPGGIRKEIWADNYYSLTQTAEGEALLLKMARERFPDKFKSEGTPEKEKSEPKPDEKPTLDIDKMLENVPEETLKDPKALTKLIVENIGKLIPQPKGVDEKQLAELIKTTVTETVKSTRKQEALESDLDNLMKDNPKIPKTMLKALVIQFGESGEMPSKIYNRDIKPLLLEGKDEKELIAELAKKKQPADAASGGAAARKQTVAELLAEEKAILRNAGVNVMEIEK
jgi:hypothetical protein